MTSHHRFASHLWGLHHHFAKCSHWVIFLATSWKQNGDFTWFNRQIVFFYINICFLHKTNTICETKSLRTGKWPSRNSWFNKQIVSLFTSTDVEKHINLKRAFTIYTQVLTRKNVRVMWAKTDGQILQIDLLRRFIGVRKYVMFPHGK